MRRKHPILLVWAAFGLVAVQSVVVMVNHLVTGLNTPPQVLYEISTAAFLILSAGIGALIVSNQPRNTIGWLFLFLSLAWTLPDFIAALVPPPPSDPTQISLATLVYLWFGNWSWWLLIGPIFLIPLLFPTGKLLSRTWRWAVLLMLACFLLFMFIVTFSPNIENLDNPQIAYRNPIGWLSEETANSLLIPFQVLLFLTAVFSVASIFVRYRRAGPLERKQISLLLYAFAVFLVIYLANFIAGLSDSDWAGSLFNTSLMGITIAIGAAILRYRLFDIDVIIRRTLIYGSLTFLLGALFFILVLALQRVFIILTGQENPAALVISTVAIVLLFNLLRLRVQRLIDRRFFRGRYDADRLLMEFSQTARDEVDLYVLADKLQTITQEAVKPKTISFWVQELED